MRRVAADFGPIPEYAGESLDRVAKLTEADYPLDGKDSIAGFISLNHEVGSVFPMVIRSEFCMGQYRDDDHRENAPYYYYKGVKL